MKSEFLAASIVKARAVTDKPLGVNIPLLREDSQDLINTALEEGIRIFFTSAGSPGKWTPYLKKKDCVVVQVVPSVRLARKSQDAGVDAVVVEGTEAGGHNGLEELTTLTLVRQAVRDLEVPVIAAGGIVDGAGIAAALALGADGVQLGTRFAATVEASAHENYKRAILESREGDAGLAMGGVAPTRFKRNALFTLLEETARRDPAKIPQLLRDKHERRGILEGDLEHGMLEMGQGSAQISDILPVGELFPRLVAGAEEAADRLKVLLGR